MAYWPGQLLPAFLVQRSTIPNTSKGTSPVFRVSTARNHYRGASASGLAQDASPIKLGIVCLIAARSRRVRSDLLSEIVRWELEGFEALWREPWLRTSTIIHCMAGFFGVFLMHHL